MKKIVTAFIFAMICFSGTHVIAQVSGYFLINEMNENSPGTKWFKYWPSSLTNKQEDSLLWDYVNHSEYIFEGEAYEQEEFLSYEDSCVWIFQMVKINTYYKGYKLMKHDTVCIIYKTPLPYDDSENCIDCPPVSKISKRSKKSLVKIKHVFFCDSKNLPFPSSTMIDKSKKNLIFHNIERYCFSYFRTMVYDYPPVVAGAGRMFYSYEIFEDYVKNVLKLEARQNKAPAPVVEKKRAGSPAAKPVGMVYKSFLDSAIHGVIDPKYDKKTLFRRIQDSAKAEDMKKGAQPPPQKRGITDTTGQEKPEVNYSMGKVSSYKYGGKQFVDFDILIKSNSPGIYLSTSVIWFQYDPLVFGQLVNTNKKLKITRGSRFSAYSPRIASDSTGDTYFGTSQDIYTMRFFTNNSTKNTLLPTGEPDTLYHVSLEFTGLIDSTSVRFFDYPEILDYSWYTTSASPAQLQEAVSTFSFPEYVPLCKKPIILGFNRDTMVAGTDEIFIIKGKNFGKERGNNEVFLSRAEKFDRSIDSTNIFSLDPVDYLVNETVNGTLQTTYWTDTEIHIKVPSVV